MWIVIVLCATHTTFMWFKNANGTAGRFWFLKSCIQELKGLEGRHLYLIHDLALS